ncbi:DMT family transporter [Glaciecola sp. XM2]|jgi:drug/metabolite transporter (DMT)-like permease|uniref:DMT family transporter n=1 Tax=Glaciecola sp. XM2 TaxID=1914931 RepID=UPI001BDE5FE8|nr:DMT family transporter [Glaciecola sp. XM2]MBT1450959.1 DMT family transporter [Glaciecola sp. XM2]
MTDTPRTRTALIELHIAVCLFGLAGLFGKWIIASASVIVAGRAGIAAIAIFIIIQFYGDKLNISSSRSLLGMIISGGILAVHWLAFFHAIQVSSVAIGVIGFATFPLFVALLEPFVSKQRFRKIDVASALMVTVGLIVVAPSFDWADNGTQGLVWALISGALFAVLMLLNRQLVKHDAFMTISCFQHSVAAIALLPIAFHIGTTPNTSELWLLLGLGLVCTALPQTLFIKSLRTLRAQLASAITGLEPLYAIFFAALLLHEIPTLKTLFGAIIVFAGIIVAMRAERSANTQT